MFMGGLPACVYTTFNMPDTHGQKKVALDWDYKWL